MAQLTFTSMPNHRVISFTPGATNAYFALPSLSLDNGMTVFQVVLRSAVAGGAADGSPFQFLMNQVGTPAAGTIGKLVSGSGQNETVIGNFNNLWVKAGNATDLIIAELYY